MNILKMLQFIFKRVQKQWPLLFISIVILIIIAGLQFVIPQITEYIIDVVIPNAAKNQLFWQLILLITIALLLAILTFTSSYLISLVSQHAIVDLRVDLYKHILKQDFNFYELQKTGDLMTRFSEDIKTIQDLISPNTLRLIGNIFTFSFVLVFMLLKDYHLTLLIALTFPVLFGLNRFFGRRIKKSFRLVRQSTSHINNQLQNSLTSILLIKSFTSEPFETAIFQNMNNENCQNLIKTTKYQSLFSPSIDIVNYVGMAIVLGYGALMAINKVMTVGEIVAYLAYLKLLQSPMRDFSLMISRLQQAIVSYERIMELYDEKPQIINHSEALRVVNLQNKVTFNHVDFSYDNQLPILDDVSFEIPNGKIIALVGLSGSGKTTITKLLMRLYEIENGAILFDETNIKQYELNSLRQSIGIVTQDVELIDGSIKENILYNHVERTQESLHQAAAAANILTFINSLPDKFETQVGQKGLKLSGGQKQRIAIARIFLKKPSLLILDEATASLDNESEKYIQKSLDSLMQNQTTLVIAHRLSTIQKADNIIVMEHGKVIETGNHQTLMKKKKRYFQLYQAQFD